MTPAMTRALDLHQPFTGRLPEFPTEEERHAVRTLNKVRASLLDDDWPKKIAAFRSLFSLSQHDQPKPAPLSVTRLALHMRLLEEEFKETRIAANCLEEFPDIEDQAIDFAEWVDGIIDLIYVGLGALLEAGFSPQQVNMLMTEVHASNMTKTDEHGKPIYDEGGKVLKGPNYLKADIAGLIQEMTNG